MVCTIFNLYLLYIFTKKIIFYIVHRTNINYNYLFYIIFFYIYYYLEFWLWRITYFYKGLFGVIKQKNCVTVMAKYQYPVVLVSSSSSSTKPDSCDGLIVIVIIEVTTISFSSTFGKEYLQKQA